MRTSKSIISLIAWFCFLPMQAQTVDREAMYIYQTDGSANIFFRSEVIAISLEMRDGEMHQVVYTKGKKYDFVISKIQSMSFVNPDKDTYRPQMIGDETAPTFGKVIDLGLPSGTLWASRNVGASKPEEYGGYYAWGETEEKDKYNATTYIHCIYYHTPVDFKFHDLGSDISGTVYDVAHVKWGGDWVMPTNKDFKELYDNSIKEWTTINGVNGVKFTSSINGNSIFFPAAGIRIGNYLSGDGKNGGFWSSKVSLDESDYAYSLYFFREYSYWECTYWWLDDERYHGLSVRPVVRN